MELCVTVQRTVNYEKFTQCPEFFFVQTLSTSRALQLCTPARERMYFLTKEKNKHHQRMCVTPFEAGETVLTH